MSRGLGDVYKRQVYYLSPSGSWPIPNIGAWNLGIGFALIMIGFLMTMGWR